MPYPINVTTVTVTGQWIYSNGGAPAIGTIEFTPNSRLVDTATAQIIDEAPLVVELDATGSMSVVLMATDDADLVPLNWSYYIVERIENTVPNAYFLQFPAAGSPYDLAGMVPLQQPPGLIGYVSVAEVGRPGGVASLDSNGCVPVSQLCNGGGGGGAYLEVSFGLTGNLTVTHNFGKHPIVQLLDPSDSAVWCSYSNPDLNHVHFTFPDPFTGKVVLTA